MKDSLLSKHLTHFHFEYVAAREINEVEMQDVRAAMDLYLKKGLNASFERKEKLRQFQNLINK